MTAATHRIIPAQKVFEFSEAWASLVQKIDFFFLENRYCSRRFSTFCCVYSSIPIKANESHVGRGYWENQHMVKVERHCLKTISYIIRWHASEATVRELFIS